MLISEKRKNEIIYYKNGQPYKWVDSDKAVTLGDLERMIIKKYEKEKLKNLRKKILFNNSQIKEIRELKKQGLSNIEISRKMGCSEGTIRNYLKKATQTP